jgi:hypothetical protein
MGKRKHPILTVFVILGVVVLLLGGTMILLLELLEP